MQDSSSITLFAITVILRSDPAVARKTVDLVEIWKGEIVMEDVELTEQKK